MKAMTQTPKGKRTTRLMKAVTGLMGIVEGRFSWNNPAGKRLVDTPEWAELYCAWWERKRDSEKKKQ